MVFITHSIDEAILLGDRVAVMSDRPGRILEIIDIDYRRPRTHKGLRAAMKAFAKKSMKKVRRKKKI